MNISKTNVYSFLVGATIALSLNSEALAVSASANKIGYIINDSGDHCAYKQEIIEKNRYFHGKRPSINGIITFDDPKCMSGKEFGHVINKVMINNIVSKWYSHGDANFDTKHLHKSSAFQKKGECIQSETYSTIGIAIEYFIKNNNITGVIHGSTAGGCKD